jgi:hypothetical protein
VPTNPIFEPEGKLRARRAEVAAGSYREFVMS